MRLDDGRVLVHEGRASVRHYVAVEDVVAALRSEAVDNDPWRPHMAPADFIEREAREGRL
jgi:predicted FMN-binding regulatory protein PaiB